MPSAIVGAGQQFTGCSYAARKAAMSGSAGNVTHCDAAALPLISPSSTSPASLERIVHPQPEAPADFDAACAHRHAVGARVGDVLDVQQQGETMAGPGCPFEVG